jgi:SOS-response transcriptional repressor LexA
MYSPLTPKQLRVLEELRRHGRLRGYMPTVRELAKTLALSPTNVYQHVAALERKGWLVRDGSPRGIALLEPTPKAQGDRASRVTAEVRNGLLAVTKQPIKAMPSLPIAITKPHLSLIRVADEALASQGIQTNDLLLVDRSRRIQSKRRTGLSLRGEKGLILAIIRPL